VQTQVVLRVAAIGALHVVGALDALRKGSHGCAMWATAPRSRLAGAETKRPMEPPMAEAPVVLVHGAFADASSWRGVNDHLAQAGVAALAPAESAARNRKRRQIPLLGSRAARRARVTRIFHELGLGPTATEHRRVLAVLTYVGSSCG
jgi:hypothetical protein